MARIKAIEVPIHIGIVVRPGDTLVVCAQAGLTNEQAEVIRSALLDEIPGLANVVVAGGITSVAAYRPSAEGTQP
jgi:hypothetical protein